MWEKLQDIENSVVLLKFLIFQKKQLRGSGTIDRHCTTEDKCKSGKKFTYNAKMKYRTRAISGCDLYCFKAGF